MFFYSDHLQQGRTVRKILWIVIPHGYHFSLHGMISHIPMIPSSDAMTSWSLYIMLEALIPRKLIQKKLIILRCFLSFNHQIHSHLGWWPTISRNSAFTSESQKGSSMISILYPFRELENMVKEDKIIILSSDMGDSTYPKWVSSKGCPVVLSISHDPVDTYSRGTHPLVCRSNICL